MPSILKPKTNSKLFRIERNEWEFWLFVVSLVTILGFFVQTHRQIEANPNYHSQPQAEFYDIRIPNNSRVVQDRLETGR